MWTCFARFHRGQPVYVEGKDTVRFPAIISAIGTEVVSHDMCINNNTVGLHFIKNSTYIYKVLNLIFFQISCKKE